MEEILLLGLKDQEGYTSLWNDSISSALRVFNRIRLQPTTSVRKYYLERTVELIDSTATGNPLLDETLRYIKEVSDKGKLEKIEFWIDVLTGESWNPFYSKYQLKNVRERISKSLKEKGILCTQKQLFLLFDVTTHPLEDINFKKRLVDFVASHFLVNWQSDVTKFNKRVLALVLMANYADVIDNVFSVLSDDQFDLATKRLQKLVDLDPNKEALRSSETEILWAVINVFNSR